MPVHCPLKAARCDNGPQQITEEMGIHKGWYIDARQQTLDSIEDFANHLMNDYIHDYGTVCHAIAALMMGMLHAANETKQGGLTGFQAGAVMWEVIKHMNYPTNKCGLRLIDYDDMLYPQYEYKYTNHKLSKETFEAMQKEAANRLEKDSNHAHPKVIAHWQSIVDGKVPFGYEIEKDEPERIEEEMNLEKQVLPDTEE